jgi:hypothetical protein
VPKDSQKAKLMNSRRLALLSREHASPLQLFAPSSLLFDRSGARNEIASFEAKRYSEMNGRIDKDIETVTLISGQETERETEQDNLPRTATTAQTGPDRLGAVTLAWWRYHRRNALSQQRIGRRV